MLLKLHIVANIGVEPMSLSQFFSL